ncbi:IEC3 subunit of the Ino80 complex, chromatin re-modelling-domain-containing protein [Podospora appendiculata]|uniref:IEC3 subunit of the Ino80 complex, chromatin re-modelling-domain-containing protein n=1 Tax=Podospora appendiculata TaxID=314037 RepID=A0AAE1C7W7_9PEZI|nr:IEC3 subunit of the Ino80 complex, chromatin re-modelling-domain-containing protein [Podospora appendiculata]
MADDKPTYRSWKKKYRKMRIVFDQKMHDGEELHRLEQKALATARRLAVQKDRLLDLLLDVNNSAQMPPEKRFDLALDPPSDPEGLFLDIDRPSTPPTGVRPAKSYKQLLHDTPHFPFASAEERFPELLADLEAGRDSPADPSQGQTHPPSFLTADDLDNYIWEIDTRLAKKEVQETGTMPKTLPTLAPLARANGTTSSSTTTNGAAFSLAANIKDPLLISSSSRDFALRNPTSVYNWLRKHAPGTFLQDAEAQADDNEPHHPPSSRRTKAERGSGVSTRGGSSTRGKRGSAAAAAAAHRGDRERERERDRALLAAAAAAAADPVESIDDDMLGYNLGTPGMVGKGAGKRKRVIDEDPGYRPKGGSSRPNKKKRKSGSGAGDSEVHNTPTTSGSKKSRKSGGGGDD